MLTREYGKQRSVIRYFTASTQIGDKYLLLNIVFHAPMRRFRLEVAVHRAAMTILQLELINYFTYFTYCVFISCRKGLEERNTQLSDGTTLDK